MVKLNKKNLLNALNKISGWIVIILGVLVLINPFIQNLSEVISTLGVSFIFMSVISGIALIFLGIYVLRFEKWAIILSGVYGIVLLISSWLITRILVGWDITDLIQNIPQIILIINWWVQK